MKTIQGKTVTVFGQHDANTIQQLDTCMEDERAVAGALCADGHLGYSMPIGGVIAYDAAISPSGVGFDIACGNMAVKTNINFTDWETHSPYHSSDASFIKGIMREIQKKVEFGMGRNNPTPIDHALFDADVWPDLEKLHPGIKKIAANQLGTVGSGNHYVDLLVDEEHDLWVANHFGSRGLGHKIASGFLNLAAGREFKGHAPDNPIPTVLDLDTDLGQFYLDGMKLAGAYAYAGREYVIDQVMRILGAEDVFSVHNHHNYAWFENDLWVVRKGATPLTREPAFIGGSMGDVSVIVRGVTNIEPFKQEHPYAFYPPNLRDHDVIDIGALGSAPHGAGRVMSRTRAAGKIRHARDEKGKRYQYRDASTAEIDWDAARADLTARGIVVLGAGADEAPGVYKSLETVLAAHSNIEILHTLQPIGVVMAGPDERDDYKD